MIAKNYIKKPVVVRAVQYQGDLGWGVHKVFPAMRFSTETDEASPNSPDQEHMLIETLEGVMTASKGDYIIEGVKGEYYPCRQDIFEETYEEVVDE